MTGLYLSQTFKHFNTEFDKSNEPTSEVNSELA